MKKCFLTIALVAVAVSVSAQIKLDGVVGLNFANQTESEGNKSETGDSKIGLKLGVTGDYLLNDYLSLRAGLVFSQKGVSESDSDTYGGQTHEYESKTTLNYLQIPINAVGRYKINDDISVFGLAGPYLAFALSGKEKETESVGGQSQSKSESIKFGSSDDKMNGFDYGLTLGAGVEYKLFSLRLEYDLGLGNLYNGSGDYSLKNRNFGISVGYSFFLK
jgi:long-subunit fatty acid transport protein